MTMNTAGRRRRTGRVPKWVDRAQFAGLASAGAGACHLSAAGMHAESLSLARIFVIMGAAQLIAGLVLALGGGRPAAVVVAIVNIVAAGGWGLTRTVGISWVAGLEGVEPPQFADTVCAVLAVISIVLAVVVLLRGVRQAPRSGLAVPGAIVGLVSVVAMLTGATHVHSHDMAGGGHDMPMWPRPFFPTQPIDFSGVPGVTPEQQARAEKLVASTLLILPQFAEVTRAEELGFTSIGDGASGYEHYVNFAFLQDDAFLDPNKPESLVYQVAGDKRTLVAAMFAASGMSLTDPMLVDYGGPLMQWHVHGDLCWSPSETVVANINPDGNCPPGSANTLGDIPMVHVWIAPNPCGPFAALGGNSAGQVAGAGPRVDQCAEHSSPRLTVGFRGYPRVIVPPSVSCHASLLATARLMNGDLRMAPMNARFGAARYHGSLRMTSTKSTTRISSLSFQTSCSNVSSKTRLRPSRQCSMLLPTRMRAVVSSAGVRSARW